MKFGLGLVMRRVPPGDMASIAREAESLGFESIWVPDHVVFPSHIGSPYPYDREGASPVRPDSPWLDPFGVLAHLAAVTSRVRLGVAVYILPLRNPFLTARAATTVDILSGGRLELGVGIGWLREEFEIVGEDFRTRAGRASECVQVLKALWTESEPEFHGRHFDFAQVKFEPKPVQKPHPPLIFGGETPAALRRAAALGDGWFGTVHSPESMAAFVAQLRALRREAGREDRRFEVSMLGGPWVDLDVVKRYEEAGVDRIAIYPWRKGADPGEQLQRFAQEVIARA